MKKDNMPMMTEGHAVARLAERPHATSALIGGGDGDQPQQQQQQQQYRIQAAALLSFLFVAALIVLFRYEEVAEFLRGHEQDVEAKEGGGNETSSSSSSIGSRLWGAALPFAGNKAGTPDQPSPPSGQQQQTKKSLPELLEALKVAKKDKFDELLRADYGQYAADVFDRSSVFNAFHIPSNASMVRLKRRMKMKVIESQLGGGERATFTWVAGGHSAAAAHGNLLNQSYSVAIERASGPVFDAAGIDFVSKAYAHGSFPSGPELSLCMEAGFGLDIDVLWWDFGMTDGNNYWLYWLWSNRAGVHPTFPTLFAYGQRNLLAINAELAKNGMGTFVLNDLQSLRSKLPDSAQHPNPARLPRGVAWYMCGGHHENDAPCGEHKWATKPPCQTAKFQVSWHNGWKDHLFIGYVNAVVMVEALIEAVDELHQRDVHLKDGAPPSVSADYLATLRLEEDMDRAAFAKSDYPTDIGEGALVGADTWSTFLRGKAICHSAKLPNQARFDGLVTEGKRGVSHGAGYYTDYDVGYDPSHLPVPNPANETTPPTLTVLDLRQACEVPLNHDWKDGFIVRHEDGWMTDVLPNNAEVEAFVVGTGSKIEREGLVMMCTSMCGAWSRCEGGYKGYLPLTSLSNGNISITVDGQPVVGVKEFKARCFVLVGEGGTIRFGNGKKDGRRGQYEIKYRVNLPGRLVISSVIIL